MGLSATIYHHFVSGTREKKMIGGGNLVDNQRGWAERTQTKMMEAKPPHCHFPVSSCVPPL